MRRIAILAWIALLGGCGSPQFREADGRILCDPESGHGFIVEHRIGDVSIVQPVPQASLICAKYNTNSPKEGQGSGPHRDVLSNP